METLEPGCTRPSRGEVGSEKGLGLKSVEFSDRIRIRHFGFNDEGLLVRVRVRSYVVIEFFLENENDCHHD